MAALTLQQHVGEVRAYWRWLRHARTVTIDGLRLEVDYARWSSLLIRRVLAGRYEVEERRLIPKVVAPGDRVLEIGGGVGLVAMLCARAVGPENVFVYEANPKVLEVASRNFALNGLDISITHGAVVGDASTEATVTFYVHDNFWSSSLLSRGKNEVAIEAPALRIGALIQRHQPTVLIADVEGAEYDILEGCDLSGVQKLCIEFHTRYIGVRKVSDLVRSLLERGFLLELEKSEGEVLFFSRPPPN